MYIVELFQPGTFLDGDDRTKAFSSQKLISCATNAFYEAHAALHFFLSSDVSNKESRATRQSRNIFFANRQSELEEYVISTSGLKMPSDYEQIRFETDKLLRKEKISFGMVPRFLKSAPSVIYAKAFLDAFSLIRRILIILRDENASLESLKDSCKLLDSYFPDLTKVRNSTQHIEDRMRGLGANRPLELKPINKDGFVASAGTLVMCSFIGSKFIATKDGGELGELDISFDSLQKMGEVIQMTLNSFQWYGLKVILPEIY